MAFPCGSVGKESACIVGALASIPALERSPGEGNGYPFQCSGLENSVDCIVPGIDPWVGKIPWRRERLPIPVFWPGEFHGLYSPWNSLGQNTGVVSLSPLQGIFPTQGSNPGLLNYRRILYQLSHKGRPISLWCFVNNTSFPLNL